MSIIKKIDDQKTVIANKSIIDHSQLANRNAYGAHSIDAIRKLPEKLTSLKKEDETLSGRITQERTERIEGDELLQGNINTVEDKARQINIEEISGTGKIKFTNYGNENEGVEIQAGFLPDDDTLELTEIEGNQKLALKNVYVDGKTIVGTGARPFNVDIENKKINSTTITSFDINTTQFIEGIHSLNMHIKNGTEVQLRYAGEQEIGVLDVEQIDDTLRIVSLPDFQITDGIVEISNEPQEIAYVWEIVNINKTLYSSELGLDITGTAQVGDIVSFTIYTGENELQAIAIGDPTGIITPSDVRELQTDSELHGNEISDLSKRVDAVEGIGGYLLPYDFDTTTPDLPKDNIVLDSEGNYDASASTLSKLTQYALDQIPTITNPADIWNGTRVTNLENNHTWILNNNYPDDFSWTDLGEATIGVATEFTLGTVKSSNDNLKVSVNDLTGEMTVNNLEEELTDIKSNLNYIIVKDNIERDTLTVKEGLIVYVRDTDITYIYEDSKWKQSQYVQRLIGSSSSTAINLATDMDVGKLYIVNGYLRRNSSSTYITIARPTLILKLSTTTAMAYSVKLSYSSSSAIYGPDYVTSITFNSSTGYITTTTLSADTDNITTSKNSNNEIQAIGLINNSDIITAAQVIEALTITRV